MDMIDKLKNLQKHIRKHRKQQLHYNILYDTDFKHMLYDFTKKVYDTDFKHNDDRKRILDELKKVWKYGNKPTMIQSFNVIEVLLKLEGLINNG